jgi:site-specific recombinase XerD
MKKKASLLDRIESFFGIYLKDERGVSVNTIRSYRDTLKLFLKDLSRRLKKTPIRIDESDLTAANVTAFLNDIERVRKVSVRTRNQRLAALKTFFSYLTVEDPERAGQYGRITCVTQKRGSHRIVDYLTEQEMGALFKAAISLERNSNRNLLLVTVLYNTGARVQEVCDLKIGDLELDPPPSVLLTGKGQKARKVPLWPKTAKMIQSFLEEENRLSDQVQEHLFQTERRRAFTRFGVLYLIKRMAKIAERDCLSFKRKRITPHVLRHTTAMHLLQAGVEFSIIKNWLGHVSLETTQTYVEIDIEMKRKALIKSKKLRSKHELREVVKNNKDVIEWLESL